MMLVIRGENMHKHIMVIINPVAGKGNVKQKLFILIEEIMKHQDIPTIFFTQYKYHAKKLIEQYAKDYDIVICSGGDGTFHEVVSGCMKSIRSPLLCYIPSGTVNDFANTLRLSSDVKTTIQNLYHKQKFACDIGQFNQQYFSYVAAFGAFTNVSYTTSQQSKNIFGRAAYILEGFLSLSSITSYKMRIAYDQEILEDDFIFGAISNAKTIGGLAPYHIKHAELDDGLFEVMLIKSPQNPLDIQSIITALMKQEVHPHFMYFFKTAGLYITSSDKIAWTLDGEDGGKHKEVLITNKNKAITLLV